MKRVGLDQISVDLKDSDPEIKKLAAKALLKDASCSGELIASILKDADKADGYGLYDILFDDENDFSSVFRAASESSRPQGEAARPSAICSGGAFTIEDGITMAWRQRSVCPQEGHQLSLLDQ